MEVPTKAMPGPEGTKSDVLQDPSPARSEAVETQLPVAPVVTDQPKGEQKGSQTPEPNLYAALEEERRMRREAERKLQDALTPPQPQIDESEMSDEGKYLKSELDATKSELAKFREKEEMNGILTKYPDIRGAEDFDDFRSKYPGSPLELVAQAFLSHKGITSPRKGLEQPTGGARQAPQQGYSEADVKRLRENSPRQYAKLIQSGKLDPSLIK